MNQYLLFACQAVAAWSILVFVVALLAAWAGNVYAAFEAYGFGPMRALRIAGVLFFPIGIVLGIVDWVRSQ